MKLIISLLALALLGLIQTGCSAGASVDHGSHSHGVGLSSSTSAPGISAGVNVR